MMKRRILVMNGHRLVQSEHDGKWKVDKVEKAKSAKPGLYNIYLSIQADKSKAHDGVVVYADKEHIYQQVGKEFVTHDRELFDKLPEIGVNSRVKYESGKAVVSASSINPAGKKIS